MDLIQLASPAISVATVVLMEVETAVHLVIMPGTEHLIQWIILAIVLRDFENPEILQFADPAILLGKYILNQIFV